MFCCFLSLPYLLRFLSLIPPLLFFFSSSSRTQSWNPLFQLRAPKPEEPVLPFWAQSCWLGILVRSVSCLETSLATCKITACQCAGCTLPWVLPRALQGMMLLGSALSTGCWSSALLCAPGNPPLESHSSNLNHLTFLPMFPWAWTMLHGLCSACLLAGL